jgi:hypothetical protein
VAESTAGLQQTVWKATQGKAAGALGACCLLQTDCWPPARCCCTRWLSPLLSPWTPSAWLIRRNNYRIHNSSKLLSVGCLLHGNAEQAAPCRASCMLSLSAASCPPASSKHYKLIKSYISRAFRGSSRELLRAQRFPSSGQGARGAGAISGRGVCDADGTVSAVLCVDTPLPVRAADLCLQDLSRPFRRRNDAGPGQAGVSMAGDSARGLTPADLG